MGAAPHGSKATRNLPLGLMHRRCSARTEAAGVITVDFRLLMPLARQLGWDSPEGREGPLHGARPNYLLDKLA